MSVARGRSRAGRGAARHGGATPTAPAFEPPPPLARTPAAERPRRGLATAWRRRPTLLAATLAAGLISYTVAHNVRPEYETSARVLVGPLGGESKTLQASSQLVETYAQLATTRTLIHDTARRLHLPPRAIKIRVDVDGVTRFLTIHARDADPGRAAAVANAQAAALVALSTRKGAGDALSGRLQVTQRALPSEHAVSPSPAVIAVVAAIAGLLVAVLVALLVERTDHTVRSGEDAEAATGAPCIGLLSRAALRAMRERPAVLTAEGDPAAVEELGALAAKLHARRGQSLLVIAMHGDATVLAGNLAAALAAQGSRVAVVDVGDDAAAGGDALDHLQAGVPGVNGNGNGNGHGPAVHRVPRPVLTPASGPTAQRAEAALERLEANADMVVLHASRLERSPTALTWARVADGTVVVAERDRTAVPELRATAETLRMVGAPVVGIVLAEQSSVLRR